MERKPNMEHIVKAQAPRETMAMVCMPAGWSEVERSNPTNDLTSRSGAGRVNASQRFEWCHSSLCVL
eukprot:5594878-Ditylum_brightwellii.AAC.1